MNSLVPSKSCLYQYRHRIFKAQLVSNNATFTTSSSAPNYSLPYRIWKAGNPSASIVSIIEEWLEEGKFVKHSELQQFIKQLRNYRRFTQALELSEWMNDQKAYKLSTADIAIRLDLISKVHGVQEADNYFNSVSDHSRGYQVYGALLNCYAYTKKVEKAEDLMREMKNLGFVKSTLCYNSMLNLYSQTGRFEMLDMLIADMAKRGIKLDTFSFNIRLNAYVACSDMEGMEKLLSKIESDPEIKMDFHNYFVAANGYQKAGLFNKSLMMLKKSEQLINGNSRRFAYEVLLTLYAALGYKAETFRVWSLYKNLGRVFNSGYISMISSLAKLDDLNSAEKIWEEWNSGEMMFDIRVPNVMIGFYCRKGMLEKAEACINKIVERGNEPDTYSWEHLAGAYLQGGRVMEAVESIKKAMATIRLGQKFRMYTLEACLECLKARKLQKS